MENPLNIHKSKRIQIDFINKIVRRGAHQVIEARADK